MKSSLNAIYISEILAQKLDRMQEYPLTSVVAPAGYGKSTAVNWFRERSAEHAVFLWLNVLSESVAEFWQGMASCASRVDAEAGEGLLQMGLPSDGATCRAFFALLEQGLGRVDREVYVVIDDCHLLPREPVYPFLSLMIRQMPPRMHVVLLSRAPVLDHQDRLLFSGRINEITVSDLRFGEREILRYYALCGVPITPDDAAYLEKVSEGWVSVLYLNLKSMVDAGRFADVADIHSMMSEILYEPLRKEEKELLTALSILPGFSAEQAVFLSGRTDAEAMLQALVHNNAFITYSRDCGYKLHHLLQESVHRAFEAMPAERQQTCLRRGGEWYLSHGDAAGAMQLFYTARDFGALMKAVQQDRGSMLTSEHREELLAWFRNCPREILDAHPLAKLIYVRELCAFNLRRECRQVLDELIQWLEQNRDLSPREKNNLRGEVEIVENLLSFHDLTAMRAHQENALRLMDRPTHVIAPSAVWNCGSPSVLASFHGTSGAMSREVKEMQTLMPIWYRLNPRQGSGAEHVMEGEWNFCRGRITDAGICLHRGLNDAGRDRQLSTTIAAQFLRLRIEVYQGEFDRVDETLRQLREMSSEARVYLLLHTVDLCEAWIFSLLGQLEQIAHWLLHGKLETCRLNQPALPILHLVYSQVLLSQGKYLELIGREADERKLYRGYSNLLGEIYLNIQLSAAYDQLGKRKTAMRFLELALGQAMPDSLYMPFVENGDFISIQLRELSDGSYGPQIRTILEMIIRFRRSKERILREYFGKRPTYGLTEREREIACMAAQGRRNKEIAAEIHLSESRIKVLLSGIYQKLDLGGGKDKRREIARIMGIHLPQK